MVAFIRQVTCFVEEKKEGDHTVISPHPPPPLSCLLWCPPLAVSAPPPRGEGGSWEGDAKNVVFLCIVPHIPHDDSCVDVIFAAVFPPPRSGQTGLRGLRAAFSTPFLSSKKKDLGKNKSHAPVRSPARG
eukprot:Hpha_TRINITY_DN11919_c0_g1::TRINITY_DN11919_c0_g1_i2::g.20793::m.20793